MRTLLFRFFSIAFGLALTVLSAMAQTTTGSIVGLVTDSTGAAVPGASVTVTSVDTGIATKTITNISGNYVVTPLPVGHLFGHGRSEGLQEIGERRNHAERAGSHWGQCGLEVGQITETVEVQARRRPCRPTRPTWARWWRARRLWICR